MKAESDAEWVQYRFRLTDRRASDNSGPAPVGRYHERARQLPFDSPGARLGKSRHVPADSVLGTNSPANALHADFLCGIDGGHEGFMPGTRIG